MSTLIIAEHNNTTLNLNAAQCVNAAKQLGEEIHILVAGSGCESVASQAAALAGVSTVLMADAESLAHQLAEDVSSLIVGIADDYDYVLAPATTMGKNLMPRISALLDLQSISDVISIEAKDTFKRPIYAGNVIATVQSQDAKKLLTIRCTAFDSVETGGSAEIKAVETPDSSGLSAFVGEELAESDRPELSAASIVVSGGRGLQSGENFELLYSLADKLNAAVGASRAAVDAGFVPNDMQVGQTGKIVAPDLYVAVGISGAIQHLAGMKESKTIVAINKDEDAPIFQVADYGLVADLFDVVPELIEKVS